MQCAHGCAISHVTSKFYKQTSTNYNVVVLPLPITQSRIEKSNIECCNIQQVDGLIGLAQVLAPLAVVPGLELIPELAAETVARAPRLKLKIVMALAAQVGNS